MLIEGKMCPILWNIMVSSGLVNLSPLSMGLGSALDPVPYADMVRNNKSILTILSTQTWVWKYTVKATGQAMTAISGMTFDREEGQRVR